jgi:YHS domain-containing protein
MSKTSKLFVFLMLATFILVLTGVTQLQAAEKVKCPVSGKEINKEDAAGSMEYKGETYYFCCAGCETKFKEDPDKYVSGQGQGEHKHSEQGEVNEDGTVVDPVCGMKIKKEDAKYSYEYNGMTYYFCMEGCKEKFVKNPEEYIKASEEKVTCPVSGEEIKKSDAAGSMEYKGQTYYFCCAGCEAKFKEDPEKYIKNPGANGHEEGACSCSTKKK